MSKKPITGPVAIVSVGWRASYLLPVSAATKVVELLSRGARVRQSDGDYTRWTLDPADCHGDQVQMQIVDPRKIDLTPPPPPKPRAIESRR